jgi:hypothetical protein
LELVLILLSQHNLWCFDYSDTLFEDFEEVIKTLVGAVVVVVVVVNGGIHGGQTQH